MLERMVKRTPPPFFSVIIPIYNKEPHVERALTSVLMQSFKDFEIIVINDACTDGSMRVVESLKCDNIRIIKRESPGPGGYAARNIGIKNANGKWISFLDADDEWLPTHLENYFKLINKYKVIGVLGCSYTIISEYKSTLYSKKDDYSIRISKNREHHLTFQEYLNAELNGIRPIFTSVACIKRSILIEIGSFPAGLTSRGGDIDTWMRSIELSGGMMWSENIGAVYYQNSINMVTKKSCADLNFNKNSIKKLLVYSNGKNKKLLKKYSNRRTISAWKGNLNITNCYSGQLFSKMYFVWDFYSFFWVGISVMPHSFLVFIKNKKRIWH